MEPLQFPVSPSKRVMDLQHPYPVPNSPDMKHARTRLDSLLSGIRKGGNAAQPSSSFMEEEANEEPFDQKPAKGRPKKNKGKHKPIVFELRGKSFGMKDLDRKDSVFAMCRKWMYGKDDEFLEPPTIPPPLAEGVSLDLLATKPIYAFPGPDLNVPAVPSIPPNIPVRPKSEDLWTEHPVTDSGTIMNEHLTHWNKVKRTFQDHNEVRRKRYHRSTQLLKTVYNIAQQSQN